MSVPNDCAILDLPLKTPRLVLRDLSTDDFEDILFLCTHPEICRYIRPPMTRQQVRDHIRDRLRPWFFEETKWYSLAVCLAEDGGIIGELVFRLESRTELRAEIGYRFRPEAQGKGYGLEAADALVGLLFGKLRLHKLVAYCAAENRASRRLLSRLGMRQEGCWRKHSLMHGQWTDLCVYGMLASDRGKAGQKAD